MFEPKREKNEHKTMVGYIPHGHNYNVFKKLDSIEDMNAIQELRTRMFGEHESDVKFVVLFNNRNIRRKNPGDVILAFQKFVNDLPADERKSVRMILHTQPRDENGTDIPAIIRDLCSDVAENIIFSHTRVDLYALNRIYNVADVILTLSDNEGFGLSTHEAMLAEKMVVATVTGGLQDQMGFEDEHGVVLDEDIHYRKEWGSNSDGTYQEHGEWCIPIFPKVLTLQGSVPTPYIYSSRPDWRDAADALRIIYELPKDERERRGKLGRQFCMDYGFTNKEMGRRFIVGLETVMDNWKPVEKFGIYR